MSEDALHLARQGESVTTAAACILIGEPQDDGGVRDAATTSSRLHALVQSFNAHASGRFNAMVAIGSDDRAHQPEALAAWAPSMTTRA
eukprot:6189994-Pleurochrysis_carterae.AAC.1